MLSSYNKTAEEWSKIWKRALEDDAKLKDLAVKAGVENNPERAKQLNRCFELDFGIHVCKSKEEQDLAQYLFCMTDPEEINIAIQGRIAAAKAAGISINDL